MDRETLLKKKEILGSNDFEALYQGNPSPESGNIFQRKWFGYYRHLPEEFDLIIDSWDCAFKDKDSSDFVACGVWGKLGPNLYLIDRKKGHWGFTATLREMKSIREQHPRIDGTLVEDKANGSAVMDVLKREIMGIVPIEPTGSKEARAYAASPTIEAGNVLLPEGASWVDEYLDEMVRFPSSEHDDEVDQTTQAINYMIKGELFFTSIKRG
jgi:predicted phage terminase large subunit-like protein